MGVRSLLGRAARKVLGGETPHAPTRAPAGPTPSEAPPTDAAGNVRPTTTQVRGPDLPPVSSGLEEGLEVDAPIPGSLLLDCREPGEMAGGVAVGALLLPMDLVPHHLADLPRDRPITVYCAAGARSAGVAHWLREQGVLGAVSLAGGIGALRFGGVEVAPPPGVRPGTKVTLPDDATADGVPLGKGPHRGEVIEQVGAELRVRVYDAQGLQVLVRVPTGTPSAP